MIWKAKRLIVYEPYLKQQVPVKHENQTTINSYFRWQVPRILRHDKGKRNSGDNNDAISQRKNYKLYNIKTGILIHNYNFSSLKPHGLCVFALMIHNKYTKNLCTAIFFRKSGTRFSHWIYLIYASFHLSKKILFWKNIFLA